MFRYCVTIHYNILQPMFFPDNFFFYIKFANIYFLLLLLLLLTTAPESVVINR